MILTTRVIGVLLTMALATGGAAWGLHTFLSNGDGAGSDHGLDTDGNGKFDWLVVEADVTLPQAGTWDVSADLSTSSPPASDSCGFFGKPVPMPMVRTDSTSFPIAWVYERYFFPSGGQTVRMAFPGADIARAGVDGPYAVHARLSLGGFPYPGLERPEPIPEELIEWNYTTGSYSANAFDPPIRPAYFAGPHTDAATDVDSDGLADFLLFTANVHVNTAGNYSLYGTLSDGDGSDVVRMIAYGSRMIHLEVGETQTSLRFRGDQIRAAGVDGPWHFALTLSPSDYPYLGGTTPPADGLARPGLFYPEMLCGSTAAYRAADFDDTPELVQYTARFEEATPDVDRDGLHDALVVRAEVDVLVAAGFDAVGTLRGTGSTVVASVSSQAWLSEGLQWAEFVFPGPEIRASGVDGPYEATLSLTPVAGGFDPVTTYTTAAYKASDFDDAATAGQRYWIGDLAASPSGKSLSIDVTVVRGNDMLRDVISDTLEVSVVDSAGSVVHASKLNVDLPGPGSQQIFSVLVEGLSSGSYTIAALLGSPDRPVDSRTVVVTI